MRLTTPGSSSDGIGEGNRRDGRYWSLRWYLTIRYWLGEFPKITDRGEQDMNQTRKKRSPASKAKGLLEMSTKQCARDPKCGRPGAFRIPRQFAGFVL